jgi:hypothetical protein
MSFKEHIHCSLFIAVGSVSVAELEIKTYGSSTEIG